jgi:hypothetical protein
LGGAALRRTNTAARMTRTNLVRMKFAMDEFISVASPRKAEMSQVWEDGFPADESIHRWSFWLNSFIRKWPGDFGSEPGKKIYR